MGQTPNVARRERSNVGQCSAAPSKDGGEWMDLGNGAAEGVREIIVVLSGAAGRRKDGAECCIVECWSQDSWVLNLSDWDLNSGDAHARWGCVIWIGLFRCD